jgi:hypothetical protein
MFKLFVSVLLIAFGTSLQAQQKFTTNDLLGSWQPVSIIMRGNNIPLNNVDSIMHFMLNEQAAKLGMGDTLSKEDSSGIAFAAQIFMMFKKASFIFNANKTYRFSLGADLSEKTESGNWSFNEATQTIRITKAAKNKQAKPVKADIIKILIKGNGLLLQMEKDKEEGLVLHKKQ